VIFSVLVHLYQNDKTMKQPPWYHPKFIQSYPNVYTIYPKHVYTTRGPSLYHQGTLFIPSGDPLYTIRGPCLYHPTYFIPSGGVYTTRGPRLYHQGTTFIPPGDHVYTIRGPSLYHLGTLLYTIPTPSLYHRTPTHKKLPLSHPAFTNTNRV
jgi:hypothetical protein